ncbi:metallophosphoesterase [Microbacterium sp. R86528]|uniref:metallophosphoesterase n=1 Tax=Microbacterium sp. R86528 TaxID=3093864 RepID=UPI0037CBA0ED
MIVAPARLRPSVLVAASAVLALGVGLLAPTTATAAEIAEAPALLVTEIVPDNVGYDDFEYFEVHNTTDDAIALDTAGITFAYVYGDTDDRDRDVALSVPAGTVIDAHETVVFWLNYTTSTVDSFARSAEEFREHFEATQPDFDYDVVRVEGQGGMANSGDRGIRVSDESAEISRSIYPAGSVSTDLGASFRVTTSSTSMDMLEATTAPTPGVLAENTLVVAEPEAPGETLPLDARELLITEFAPNNVGADAYEYVEIVNTTDRDIDLAESDVTFIYDYLSGEKALDYPADSTVPAGGTAVLWSQYSPNTDGLSDADFRAFYATADDYTIIPITGQAGFANTADRGLRIESGDTVVSVAHYAGSEVGNGLGVDYRLPTRTADVTMAVLRALADPTPGTVSAEAFVAQPFVATPDPDLVTSPLQVTEIAPDTANVSGSDAYEFIEVYNSTSAPIDFRDYTLKYLYPLADLTNSATALWPATNRNAIIEPGKAIVFWVKNGANDALTADDFNAHFSSNLVADSTLFEIESAGMANTAARGIEIVTNTGFSVNRAYYNLGGVDDTTPDMPVQYAVNAADTTLQTKLGTAVATPGSIYPEQVEAGLMIVAPDAVLPAIVDATETEITPGEDFAMAFTASDDVQVKTFILSVRNNLEERYTDVELLADGDHYSHAINAVDLTGKKWFEYYVTVRDGSNEVVTDVQRATVIGADTAALRLNLEDGAWVNGVVDVVAGTDQHPSNVELRVDDVAVESVDQLETEPVFAFEASGVDTFFRNGVRIGDDVLRIFDDGIYSGWETISTPVPLSYLAGTDQVTLSVWAGTKAAPEINLDENNDDFTIRNLRLILPDGRALYPAGYEDATAILAMGDSTGKLDFYDAEFTIPADANTAAGYSWDTAAAADGTHVVQASTEGLVAAASVLVDNTEPSIVTDLVEGTRYQGEFVIDATATDEGSGLESMTASLDGKAIELPFATSSITLSDGDHTVVFSAKDAVGNTTELSVAFTTPVEEPGNELISPEDGAIATEGEDITLTARATDPTGDALTVTFAEAYRLSLGEQIDVTTGTVTTADTLERAEGRALTAAEIEQIGRIDEVSLSEASDTAFPYQMFEVTVPAEAGTDSRVRLRWDGSANSEAKVLLYGLGTDGDWHELDRALTTDGAETSFTLNALVDSADYVIDGAVTALVQHSEGFAGTDLSSRESVIEPNNVEDTPRSEYDFTLAWESDTQYYNEEFHQHQTAIHDYLLQERTDLNLQYLFHTGDIVDDYDQLWQWDYAVPEYDKLDAAELPYGVLAGNHDVGHKEIDYTNYGTFFGDERFASNPWFGGSYENNRGHYDLMTVGGIDFLMLYVGWGPGDAEIAWMNEILAQYPERIAMINLHEYMLTTGGLGPIPQQIYDEVVAANANVRTVFSGHYHDAFTRIDAFDDDGDGTDDRQVYQILFDYQGLPEGGQGYLRLMHFDNVGEQIISRTYTPSYDDYNSDDPSLELQHQDFTISYEALGIVPQQKVLATDAFSAEVLASAAISTVENVESGTEVSAQWQPGLGVHGWYVTSFDPYGATADSEVRVLTVEEASTVDPGDGDGDGDGEGDSGEDNGSGDGSGDGGAGNGGPATPSLPVPLDELDPALEGAISTTLLRVGEAFTVQTNDSNAGAWAQLWLHSTPTALGGWTQVADDGRIWGVVPSTVEPGVHTLVVQTEEGVLGWASVQIEAATTEAPVTEIPSSGVGSPAANDADDADAGALPATGATTAWMSGAAAAASLMLALGVMLLLVRRRRVAHGG